MRMQNADMEFVTFDAKDVIATSGPFTGQPMAAQIGAVSGYNATSGLSDGDKMKNNAGKLDGITNPTNPKNWLIYNGVGDDSNGFTWAEERSSKNKPENRNYLYVENGADADKIFTLISEWLKLQRGN